MNLPDQFDICDEKFHIEALLDLNPNDTDAGVEVLIAWHTTATTLLQIGKKNGIDGPAARERWVNKPSIHLQVRQVERRLEIAYDAGGRPYFCHSELKENSLDKKS